MKHKLSAIIMRGDDILGEGYNFHIIGPRKHHRWSIHAETMAIDRAIHRFGNITGATVFVYRRNKIGYLANSRPCKECANILKRYGVKEVIYTVDCKFVLEKI